MDQQAKRLIGKRVEIPAYYDLWMCGARCGIVTSVTSDKTMLVKMDHPQVKRRVRIRFPDWHYVKFIA